MQRSPDSRPHVPNITANDEIRKLNSMQLSLSTVKWRRRPALHAHLVHELFDVGQCFYSLLLHSSHRGLDGMGPVYPARARAQKWNKIFPNVKLKIIHLLLGRVIHSEIERCLQFSARFLRIMLTGDQQQILQVELSVDRSLFPIITVAGPDSLLEFGADSIETFEFQQNWGIVFRKVARRTLRLLEVATVVVLVGVAIA